MSASDTALVLFAHGSRIETANEAVRAVARDLAYQGGYTLVAASFLELGQPDLAGAIGEVTAQGARRVVVIPYFLTLGMHLQRDLPRIVEEAAALHPGVVLDVTPPLDGHPALVQALLDRAAAALSRNLDRESQTAAVS